MPMLWSNMVGLTNLSASNEFYSAAEVPHRLIPDAQGTAQPAADGSAEATNHRSAKTRACVEHVFASIDPGPVAALYRAGAHHGGDRADQLRPKPAPAGDDGAAAAGARDGMRLGHTGNMRLERGKTKFTTKRKATAAAISPTRRATRSIRRRAANSKWVLQTTLQCGGLVGDGELRLRKQYPIRAVE